jgi:hypothetical protein
MRKYPKLYLLKSGSFLPIFANFCKFLRISVIFCNFLPPISTQLAHLIEKLSLVKTAQKTNLRIQGEHIEVVGIKQF